ncbi:MAG: hypothetical protein NC177_18290 [Ruminococcus flavefaciens]|nr:hypothetical protein [Ruminococcus flavefaciens]
MKNKNKSYVVLAILFIVFNVIAFAVPTSKTATFWIAYAFSVVAFAAQIGVCKFAFKDDDKLKSKFLGVPLIYIGSVYLIIQLVAFAVFMAVSSIPSWVAAIVCTLIFAVFVLSLIGGETAKKEIIKVEDKVQSKVFFMKSLQVELESIADQETDEEVKAVLLVLIDKVRFSDPISNDALAELESKISQKVEQLKNAEDKTMLINEISTLLSERDGKCRLLK